MRRNVFDVYQPIKSCLDIVMTVFIMFKKCFGCISADQFMSRHNDCDTRRPSQATECITHIHTVYSSQQSDANSFLVQEEPELDADVVHHSF